MPCFYQISLLISFFCLVTCQLNLPEGSPCVTSGHNGTCVNMYKCATATLTHLYLKAGFNSKEFPELPDICSQGDKDPVICCTDCKSNVSSLHALSIGPLGMLKSKGDSIAVNKCYEYFEKLPYRCRGSGNVRLNKTWSESRKCHSWSLSFILAVGGRKAERFEFPHMALLGYGEDVEFAQWLCGGTVISERFILTAAHCSSTHTLKNITFAALGLLQRTDPKEFWKIYKIKRIIVHPEYKAPSKYHDIALLETETEIVFGTDLLPACLDTNPNTDDSAEAVGWGRLGHRQVPADTLQVVKLRAFEEDNCAQMYKPHRHLKNGYDHQKQMCYGSKNRIVDTCEGDSGGPLQTNQFKCQYTVVGVTSYGKDCGILGSAGMYTRVSYYVPWIEGIVWPEETEERSKRLFNN